MSRLAHLDIKYVVHKTRTGSSLGGCWGRRKLKDSLVIAGMTVSPDEAELHSMSTLTEEGVMAVKQAACDRLLASRVEVNMQVSP